MLKFLSGTILILAMSSLNAQPVAIAVHGGAGTIDPERMTDERKSAIENALEHAVRSGHAILDEGGSSLDAVVAALRILEDAPEFNAGRGSVLTDEGRVEMDASLMDGASLEAGAVAAVRGIRHPIEAAHRVMRASPHVLLAVEGAESFARAQGLEFMDEDWFITDYRREQLERIQAGGRAGLPEGEHGFGTVGAVALDRAGNLAAGTSTGGTANKHQGRVGDSPIIGAGTYADNRNCAVSGTGQGEYFIRFVVAYDICARMMHAGRTLEEAADEVIHRVLRDAGGDGGVIALDRQGNIVMPFNTPGMYRAAMHRDGRFETGIYRDGGERSGDG